MANGDHRNWVKETAESSAALVWSRWTTIVGIPVALVVLGWAVTSFNSLQVSVAEVREVQASNTGRIDRAEQDVRDILGSRYTSADAIRDQRTQARVDKQQDFRLGILERQVEQFDLPQPR